MYELKIYKGVMRHDNDKGCKIEGQLNCQFKIDEEFDEFWPKHSKILHFNGLFLKWHEELGKFLFIGWKSKMVELNQNKI